MRDVKHFVQTSNAQRDSVKFPSLEVHTRNTKIGSTKSVSRRNTAVPEFESSFCEPTMIRTQAEAGD